MFRDIDSNVILSSDLGHFSVNVRLVTTTLSREQVECLDKFAPRGTIIRN